MCYISSKHDSPGWTLTPEPAKRFRRSALAAIVLLVTAPAGPSLAVDLPVREIILGASDQAFLYELDSLRRARVSYVISYQDLYFEKSRFRLHDYHICDLRMRSLFRKGKFLYGVTFGQNTLTLKQNNVYTDNDRMRGGRSSVGGRILLGWDSKRPICTLGIDRLRLLGSVGGEDGGAASFEGAIRWYRRLDLYMLAATYRSRIEFTETMLGYRFPFNFPFEVRMLSGKAGAAFGRSRLDISGGCELLLGEGENDHGFENLLYFRRVSAGVTLSRGIVRTGTPGGISRDRSAGSRLPGFIFAIDHHEGVGDIEMYKDGTRYMRLQDFELIDTALRLDVLPFGSFRAFAGWERVRIMHSGDSFFDVWPFIIWDVFLSKRYRLGPLDGRLDTWFIGAGALIRAGRFEIDLEGRFEWWQDEGDLRWLERKEILYPFFFKYVSHDVRIDLTNTYAIQLEPSFTFHATDGIAFHLSLFAAAPFGKDEKPPETKPVQPTEPGETDAPRRHGGLAGRLSVVFTL